jgi:hypothetical protein
MLNAPTSAFSLPPRLELRWAARAAAIIMLLTCLPYLFGLAITPQGYSYSGFLTNPDEHNVYLSLMRQAHDGAFFFSDMFTAEPQQGRVINVLWLALGLFARAAPLPLPLVYHLARVIAGWLLLLAVYCFAAQVMASAGARRAAALVLGNIHSYDVIPAAAVLAAFLIYLLISRRAGGRAILLALLIAALAAPSLLYQLWLLGTGEVSLLVKAVSQPPSPEPLYVALGFGLPLAFAAVGILRALRGNDWARLLALWLVLGAALIYAPLPFQRKLIEGLHVPICLLAALSFDDLWSRRPRRAVVLTVLLVALSLPSSLLFVRRGMRDLLENNRRYLVNLMPPLYLDGDQRAAFAFLSQHARPTDVLLANSLLSNYAPSIAGLKVYCGHWSETPDFRHALSRYAEFLRAQTPDADRQSFARGQGITYVMRDQVLDQLYLPWIEVFDGEPRRGEAFSPARSPWLESVFSQGTVTVYRVKDTGQ